MQFIDEAKIQVHAGKGGNGVISFRHEKFVPKGGPDGGDGGKGGDVVFRASRQLATLLDFRYKRDYKAPSGAPGESSNKTGRSADDLIISVPCGTLIRNAETKETVCDLVDDGAKFIVAHGGKGGHGNARFATPTNQAPRKATPGKPGEEILLELELKLLADVGIVGFPNVGKSTFISVVSAAKPKIADYPFTTLQPNLGIVRYKEAKSFVVADIPGLIEGAHEGRGLGIQFLRHIERTKVLLILIDAMSATPKDDYQILLDELDKHSPDMLDKPRVTVISRIDAADKAKRATLTRLRFERKAPVLLSSVTGEGVQPILDLLWKAVSKK
ncbi:MAG TPA: GTPase ObgE [Candidatus Kapabacteria bacterium]|nr:GTPase ObgE [Candidatus Kapabacteria bacterium]